MTAVGPPIVVEACFKPARHGGCMTGNFKPGAVEACLLNQPAWGGMTGNFKGLDKSKYTHSKIQ